MENSKVTIVLVGIGGYGETYLRALDRGRYGWDDVCVKGIVDPYAANSKYFGFFAERGISVFDDLESFYAVHKADLAVISTPIQLHKPQCCIALANGSHVLCEKPITPCVEDWRIIKEAEAASGKRVAVGFQWSFCDVMLELKADYLAGVFGKPLKLKSMVSWPRGRDYYESSTWKGRIRDARGNLINDSITSNATAHYVHNMFYITGDGAGVSAMPEDMRVELYKAKDIQTHDTIFLRGKLNNGAEFMYAASHAVTKNESPRFAYEFEQGTADLNEADKDDIVRFRFRDGRVKEYGCPFSFEVDSAKLDAMIEFVADGGVGDIACGLDTVYPHIYVCDWLMEQGVEMFPEEMRIDEGQGVFCPSLYGDLVECYDSGLLLSELIN